CTKDDVVVFSGPVDW
nr:immunoglobulin heavy chain junction region [Macaca mulatta]MOX60246.1 immunoglobulin heavy chain junction region [Macaca mulatta]MOX62946.1 immunoglobulin heavy chain junction region [Macaca mulatta]MOX64208.1 immunoglobulin heavy chain junction region [Macaca mulatta]MOX67762.1 immunoglobulin heavy chain junction region [Macaca mulatta]